MAEGVTLENMYFDVLLRDRTAEGVRSIEQNIKDKLKIELDVSNANSMNAQFEKMRTTLDGIKDAVERIREAMNNMGGGKGVSSAVFPEDSYKDIKSRLDSLTNAWKMLSGETRNTSGGPIAENIRNLAGQLKELDAQLKPAVNTMEKLNTMRERLNQLRNGGVAKDEVVTQQQIAQQTRLVQLQEQAKQLSISTAGMTAQALQQEITAQTKLNAQLEREKLLKDPNSAVSRVEAARQAAAAMAEEERRINRLVELDEKRRQLANQSGYHYDLNQLQSQVREQERLIELERKYNAEVDRANGNTSKVQRLEQEYAIQKRINDLRERVLALQDPNSDQSRIIALQQAASLQERILQKQVEILNLQSSVQGSDGVTRTVAEEQARLSVMERLARAKAELIALQSQEGRELMQLQQRSAVEKQLTQLETQRLLLEKQLAALKNGKDITNTALKREVQLEQQLVSLKTQKEWLERTNASGRTNAEELRRLQDSIRTLMGQEREIGRQRRENLRSLQNQIPVLKSIANLARNYIGVFGAWSAVKSLYRITGEFERQSVALRALMQSASQAAVAVGRLQQMALKSPFSFAELTSYAKQLSAYNIANNELLDTTKRLADLSAGLGVDMQRIILAYGQVKAATVLRGQELRQFTEAGIPMVQALADQFTKLEGKVVTTSEVFERISKKQVSFENVKQVLEDMTDIGGRFYNHQEKMVETLYGKINRMKDAYTVMMSGFGSTNSALLKAPINLITTAMQNWRTTIGFLISAAVATGVNKLVKSFKAIEFSSIATKRAIATWGGAFIIMELISYLTAAKDAADSTTESIKNLNSELSDELDKYLDDHKKPFGDIKLNVSLSDEEIAKTWEELQRKLLEMGENILLDKLLNVEDLRERCKQAIELIEDVQKAAEAATKHEFKFDWFGNYSTSDMMKNLKYYVEGFSKDFLGNLQDALKYYAKDINEAYQEAISLKQIDPENGDQGREFVMNWIKGFEAANPQMTDAERIVLENEMMAIARDAGVNIGTAFAVQTGNTIKKWGYVSNDAVKIMFDFLKAEAKKSNEDIETLYKHFFSSVKSESDEARAKLVEMTNAAYQEAASKVPAIAAYYKNLFTDVNAVASLMRSLVNIPAPNSLIQDVWDKYYKKTPGTTAPESTRPKNGQSWSDWKKDLNDQEKQAREEANGYRKQAKAIATGQEEREKLLKKAQESEERANDIARVIRENNLQEEKKGTTPKHTPRTGGGRQRDSILDRMKEEFKEYKEANELVKTLIKNGYSWATAVDEVKNMPWLNNLNENYLGLGRMEDYIDHILPLIEKHYNEVSGEFKRATREFWLSVRKEGNKEAVRVLEEKVKKLDSEIKRIIEPTIKNFSFYDRIFELIGNEDIASSAAFGGKKLFKKVEDAIVEELNRYGLGSHILYPLEDLIQMDDESLKKIFDSDYAVELVKKIREIRDSEHAKIWEKGVEALEKYSTTEDKVNAQIARNEKDLSDAVVNGYKEGSELYEALKRKGEDAIRQIQSDGMELSQVWESIFGDLEDESFRKVEKGIKLVNQMLNSAQVSSLTPEGLPSFYSVLFTDTDGLVKETKISAEKLKQLKDVVEQLYETASGKNPFKSLRLAFKELQKKPNTKNWKIFAEQLSNTADIASNLANGMTEVAEAAGNQGLAQAFDDFAKGLDSLSNIAKGFAEGGYVGAIIAGLGEALSWTARLFERHDKALDESIKKIDIYISQLEKIQERIEDILKNSLGGIYAANPIDKLINIENLRKRMQDYNNWMVEMYKDYTDGILNVNTPVEGQWFDWYDGQWKDLQQFLNDYKEADEAIVNALKSNDAWDLLLADLYVQREETRKQFIAEQDKKNSDDSALEDYRQKIDDLDKQIKDFAKDMAKELYGIDVKSWAKELTDAIVDAWAQGENAVEAFKNKVNDIMKSLAKSILAQRVMEIAMQPVLDMVTSLMEQRKGKLQEGDIAAIASSLIDNGLNAVDIITGVLNQLKAQGYDLSGTSNGNTLGKGIQSITEDTANLLASYVNAIRADVSVIRMLHEQQIGSMSEIAMSQVAQLNQIASNTLRNAEAAERIETALGSVIMIGADGAMLRV